MMALTTQRNIWESKACSELVKLAEHPFDEQPNEPCVAEAIDPLLDTWACKNCHALGVLGSKNFAQQKNGPALTRRTNRIAVLYGS
jgi:hypothetical protein